MNGDFWARTTHVNKERRKKGVIIAHELLLEAGEIYVLFLRDSWTCFDIASGFEALFSCSFASYTPSPPSSQLHTSLSLLAMLQASAFLFCGDMVRLEAHASNSFRQARHLAFLARRHMRMVPDCICRVYTRVLVAPTISIVIVPHKRVYGYEYAILNPLLQRL